MKKSILLAVISIISIVHPVKSDNVYNIKDFGAKDDNKTVATKAINKAIEVCHRNGGGIVFVPEGTFLSATVFLKSNVNLYLDKGAVLKGVFDPQEYSCYIPQKDMSRYSSVSDNGNNANSIYDTEWIKTLILGVEVENVTISGEGVIDGGHVFNSRGEEGMRGPHTIIIAEAKNILVSNITVNKSANYAFLGYDVENVVFQHLKINEGWDGIHLRGAKNIVIRDCDFYTGDDAIAGGYWESMVITDCRINSSCNGIRVIMPVKDMVISHSRFFGDGKYPHLTSHEARRTNMLIGIYLQPGGWGIAPGDLENIRIHDLEIDNMENALAFDLNKGNNARDITVENISGKNLRGHCSLNSLHDGFFENIAFRNIDLQFCIGSKEKLTSSWAYQVRNVRKIIFENVQLNYSGNDARPVFHFEDSSGITFKNVDYTGSKEEPVRLVRSDSVSYLP